MIYIEDQMIKLNGVTLPGLVKSIEIVDTAKKLRAARPSLNRPLGMMMP